MIRHHYTLEHIARELTLSIGNGILVEAFTQERNVSLLQFLRDGEISTVSVDVDDVTGTVALRPDTHRARKNSIDLFPVLLDQKCVLVTKHPHDRIITLWFQRHQLHVLLYSGGMGNVLVTDNATGMVVDALHNKASVAGTTIPDSDYVPVPGTLYEREAPYYPDVVAACRDARTYHVLREAQSGAVVFSLLPLHGYHVVHETADLFAAIRMAIAMKRSSSKHQAMRTELTRELDRRIGKLYKGIQGMQSDAIRADKADEYRAWADVLISHGNKRQAGADSVTLRDWSGNEHTIPLDSKFTAFDNAQRYYAKARKAEAAKVERAQRLPKWTAELTTARALRERLDAVENDTAALEQLYITVFRRKYMQERPNAPAEPTEQYRVFELADGYILYVGKSAANNDQLTMRFAKQNDWWFHARGVSGSHAVLKCPATVTKVPKDVLEQAAAIAAYYSNARNASYTPVVYTQRKYVRKPKGAAVGAVTLEREQVVMVRPGIPGSPE